MAQFDHCKKAEIPVKNGRSTILCMVDSSSADGLLLTLPRKLPWELSRKLKHSHDTPVTVVFFDPFQGLTHCSCRLSDPVRQGDVCVYRCEVLETLSMQERRREMKIPVAVAVELEYNGKLWPGTTGNISAGGVMLLSALTAHKGDVLRFRFYEAGTPIPLAAQVLRVELRPNQDGNLIYGYGCCFVDLQPEHASLLRSYVLQKEQRLYFSNN